MVTNSTNTPDKIAELEQRLDTGWNKLRDLELAGLWNQPMYEYWINLEKTYITLCRAAKLFKEF